jgi:hypothetical protein
LILRGQLMTSYLGSSNFDDILLFFYFEFIGLIIIRMEYEYIKTYRSRHISHNKLYNKIIRQFKQNGDDV